MAVETTLADAQGFPYSRFRAGLRVLRRIATTTLAAVSLVTAVAATAAALGGSADSGLEQVGPDGVVVVVSPTGFAWRDGIRPGQVVIRLDDSMAPGGWLLETSADGSTVIARAAPWDAALRDSLPLGVAAMVLGGLAVVFLRGHRSWAPAAACTALLLAAPVLALHGRPEASTIALGAAAAVPAYWLAWRPRLPILASGLATLAVSGYIAAWAVTRLDAGSAYDQVEAVRDGWAIWGTVLVVVGSVVLPLIRRDPVSLSRPRVGDIIVVGAVAGVALAAATLSAVPVVAIGAAILGALLVVPAWRRVVAPRAERLLLTDLREHAALEAAEAERAHLARELHDAPLQELAGVIRRLELLPEARRENDQLRAVADQLRGMATELRPPVLDDLGLAAAIEFVAEKEASDTISIVVDLDDRAGLDAASRPPAAVELALFRIAQEAIANAIRHAQPATIRVTGLVSPSRVELDITDDGRGLLDKEVRGAARRGRLGLASIRRRAQAIDAEVTIEGSGSGTRVHVRWAT